MAQVAADGVTQLPSNGVINTLQPSVIRLTNFSAQLAVDGVLVHWTTGSECNTFGYYLLRSITRNRADAQRISPLIPARGGDNVDTSYEWLDTDATLSATYVYWLQEVEIDNTLNDYGPVSTALVPSATPIVHRMYLPVAVR